MLAVKLPPAHPHPLPPRVSIENAVKQHSRIHVGEGAHVWSHSVVCSSHFSHWNLLPLCSQAFSKAFIGGGGGYFWREKSPKLGGGHHYAPTLFTYILFFKWGGPCHEKNTTPTHTPLNTGEIEKREKKPLHLETPVVFTTHRSWHCAVASCLPFVCA